MTTSSSTTITLITPIEQIVEGDERAASFRRLELRCVADLLRHLPMRYEYEQPEQTIADARRVLEQPGVDKANIAVRGEVTDLKFVPSRRPRLEVMLSDDTDSIHVMWFNTPWLKKQIHAGMYLHLHGTARRKGHEIHLINPKWRNVNPDQPPDNRPGRWKPIYPAGETLASRDIEKVIDHVLQPALGHLEDHLHEGYRRHAEIPTLAEAYRMAHRPESESEHKEGRRRLALDELLLLQLGVMLKRYHRQQTLTAIPLKYNEALDQHITDRFPFELTDAQRQVIDEIVTDLQKTRPMNRLLQGDVGSGKTAVALYAILLAVAGGHQGAIMSPTELLAEQHFASITEMLSGSKVTIELLTGSHSAPQRQDIERRLANGDIDIVIGTHALLTENVQFHSLAVAVIDEQHRFGVHQRATLRSKSDAPTTAPHALVMTATPIPRTLSLTVFGDLDISTIRDLPPGRQPIITRRVDPTQRDKVYDYAAQRLAAGEQVYVVVPVIDASETGLVDLRSHVQWLQHGPFDGRRIAAVHGRLKREQREAIMYRFRKGEIDAIIATTVIEVGVDVPNATMMIIENADRFGLAQLHQLRGRVGRGEQRSLCVLIGDPQTEDAEARLNAMVETNDGFEIAERDLRIRGPGELFGARQSGLPPFHVADLSRDLDLLRMARRDAQAWIEENPTLAGKRDALLKKRLLKAHGEALGLGDVA